MRRVLYLLRLLGAGLRSVAHAVGRGREAKFFVLFLSSRHTNRSDSSHFLFPLPPYATVNRRCWASSEFDQLTAYLMALHSKSFGYS